MAGASPIEFRYYIRKVTLEDIDSGITPIRQQQNGRTVAFMPPALQYRHKVRLPDNSHTWSPWLNINYYREGDETS